METYPSVTGLHYSHARVAPLSDPIRITAVTKVVAMVILSPLVALSALVVAMSLATATQGGLTRSGEEMAVEAIGILAKASFLLAIVRLLPCRKVNAIYLRSFRNDPVTWPRRNALQRALGRRFRLSGIRDPRRRWWLLFRLLADTLFVIRYATPKFMNLEAGRDWKDRLWRSLADCRCAFVDVTDLTPFVVDEIRLCVATVGIRRTLFIGDASRERASWEHAIQGILADIPGVDARHACFAFWDESPAGRKQFKKGVRAFASRLPPGEAGAFIESRPAPSDVLPERGRASTQGEHWPWLAVAAMLAVGLAAFVVFRTPGSSADVASAFALLSLALWAWVTVFVVQYVFSCGSKLEGAIAALSFLPVLTAPLMVYYVHM